MTAWKQLRTGRVIDLVRPDLAGIDTMAEIAVPLARIPRWSGHTIDADPRLAGYSVAQHCVLGADCLLEETGCVTTALTFLLHDAHEAMVGDVTTPVAVALDELVDTALRIAVGDATADAARAALGGGLARIALDGLKRRIDDEIHRLAGLPPRRQMPALVLAASAEMDRRMLDVERRQVLAATRGRPIDTVWPATVLKARPVRLRGALTPWTIPRAATEWHRRFEQWRIRPRAAA